MTYGSSEEKSRFAVHHPGPDSPKKQSLGRRCLQTTAWIRGSYAK